MSPQWDTKSRDELVAEIEGLRSRLAEYEGGAPLVGPRSIERHRRLIEYLEGDFLEIVQAAGRVQQGREFTKIAREIFDECCAMTGASSGYVALLSEDGQENQVLFLEAGGLPCNVDPDLPMPVRGLRAEAYKTGKAVYNNDFANSRWMDFMPEGHVRLRNVMFAPLVIDGRAEGLMGLANKDGDFTERDAAAAAVFADFAAAALRNSRVLTALAESERNFHSLFDTMREIVAIHEIVHDESGKAADYRFLNVNPPCEELLGKSRSELIGHLASEIYSPEGPPFLEVYARVAETGEPETFETYIPWLDKHLSISAVSPMKGRFATISSDITELKRDEEALRESEASLRGIIEDMPVLMNAFDENGVPLMWNRECERVTGFSAEEMVGNPGALELLYPDAEYREKLMSELAKGPFFFRNWEWKLTSKSGEEKTISWSNISHEHPVEGWDTWGVGVDVTERERTRADLERERDNFASMLAAMEDGVCIISRDYRVVYANPSLAKVFGDPGGRLCHDYFLGSDSPCVHCNMESIVKGEVVRREWRAEEHGKHYELVYTPIRDQEGGLCKLGMFRDITERVEMEERRKSLERALYQAQKEESLAVLAGGVAHDFNNILMGIMGNADLALLDLPPLSPARDTIRNIRSATLRASELSKQMLAYSGGGKFVTEPLDLSSLVREQDDIVASAVPDNVSVVLDLASRPPRARADAAQVRQALLNMVSNAGEAIGEKEGVIIVATGSEELEGAELASLHPPMDRVPGTFVYIEVSDTGAGMDDETRKRVFEPFFSTKFTGRGLGLAAISGIAKGHGGGLTVESRTGEGSSFRLYLPAAEQARDGTGKQKPGNADDKSSAATKARGRGKVLLVDDEPTILSVYGKMINMLGHDVITAPGGREALELFEKDPAGVGLVILDMKMPDVEGGHVLDRMLEIDPETPVLLSSGYDIEEATARVGEKGLAGYLQKPYNVEELKKALAKARGGRG